MFDMLFPVPGALKSKGRSNVVYVLSEDVM